jgi:hypothetical protein
MNNSGIQVFNQQNHFSGSNFHMQTNFTTSQHGYEQEDFDEDSSDEMSYHDSSEDNAEYWQQGEEEDEEDENTQTGSYQAPGVNVTWQVNHHVNYYSPSAYSYSDSQSSQMSQQPQQPKKKGLTKAQLNQLPVDAYKGKPKSRPVSKTKSSQKNSKDCGSEFSSNDTCPICIGDYKIGEKMKTLPCMHRFHNDCVDKWLSMKSDCPVCKYDLLE